MSIYATLLSFNPDDHLDDCERWELGPGMEHGIQVAHLRDDGDYHINPEKPCTCGHGEPWKHPGNRYPPTERAGLFEIAGIPAHIGREDLGYDMEGWNPFVRISVSKRDMYYDEGSGTVLLDARQVRELQEVLARWLDRVVESDS